MHAICSDKVLVWFFRLHENWKCEKVNWKESMIAPREPKRMHDERSIFLPACVCVFRFFLSCSKIAQYEQDWKHLHYELRSKEIFLTKVKWWSHVNTLFRKTLELEEELKVVGNNMKSLENSEQEVVDWECYMATGLTSDEWSPQPFVWFYISTWNHRRLTFFSILLTLGYPTWRKLWRTNSWFDNTS